MTRYRHGDGCFCDDCMAVDRVRELERNLAKARRSLADLRRAQQPTSADMTQEITAQSDRT